MAAEILIQQSLIDEKQKDPEIFQLHKQGQLDGGLMANLGRINATLKEYL